MAFSPKCGTSYELALDRKLKHEFERYLLVERSDTTPLSRFSRVYSLHKGGKDILICLASDARDSTFILPSH